MIELHHGDCLEVMKSIPDKSVDLVLTDPPYGTTACKWDSIIPFEPMWGHLKRLIKESSAVVLFAGQPFTSQLVVSNIEMFKYQLVWKKTRINGFAQAPYKFMNEHEDVAVFSLAGCSENAKPRMNYYPQGLIFAPRVVKGKKADASEHRKAKKDQEDFVSEYTGYPKSILAFDSEFDTVHPTQKPVDLLEYLIKTYTLEGDTVLDFTMGSGSTGVAAKKLKRNFIGIEKDEKYFEIAKRRIENGESCYQMDLI